MNESPQTLYQTLEEEYYAKGGKDFEAELTNVVEVGSNQSNDAITSTPEEVFEALKSKLNDDSQTSKIFLDFYRSLLGIRKSS